MATITEVARLLGVDREEIKRWATTFAEHLSSTANPGKDTARRFTESDLRVLAVIAEEVEMDGEEDDVHYALNSGRQYEEPLVEHARLHTPLFQDVPDEIDETWRHGALIGGMGCRDRQQVARAYKLAADELVELALTKHEPHELDFPVLFMYRHTVELHLKAALENPPEHHDLGELIRLLETECGNQLAGWIRDRLWDFHEIDRRSAIFRYANPGPPGELWIDFHQLQTVIGKMVEAFEDYMGHHRHASN